MKNNILSLRSIIPWLLVICFLLFTILSWIIVFRDPRALIGVGNLYPELKDALFPIQTTLTHYGLNSLPTIAFAMVAFIAITAYLSSLRITISMKKTIIFACVFQIITFLSFPILSTDIFSYIFSERVATVHQENIWHVTPATFPDDQFGVLADWKETTSIYGAMHYLLYLGPSLIGQDNLLVLVILYKLVPTIFALGSMYVLYLLLLIYKKDHLEKWVRLVFWNPLVVLEIIGSGHNDSMMIFFTLVGVYLYVRKYWAFSGVLFALAVHIKLIPIVLFFLYFLNQVRNRKLKASATFLISFVTVNMALFMFMQVNVVEYLQRVAYNGGVYWQSLPTIIQTFYPEKTGYISIVFLLWVLIFISLQWWKKGEVIVSYVTIIMVYLFFVSSAYWNWYVLWIFCLLPFLTDKKLFVAVLMLSFTSLLAYPLLWVIHRINTPSVLWPFLTYIFIFGLPIFAYLYGTLQEKRLNALFRLLKLDNPIAEKV